MKIYKKTIFTIILFLTCITNTHAACTKEEIDEFKKIEDEYTVKYEFNKDTKDYKVTFNIPMIEKFNFWLYEDLNKAKIENATKTSLTLSGVKPGKYKADVSGMTQSCDDTLKTITINLKAYNKYSEDPLCNEIEEFVLCQPTYDKEIDYDTFVSRVNVYKKSKEKKEDKSQIKEEIEQNKTLLYIEENLVQIIIITIFIILVIITTCITIKSIRKSRRLE